MACTALPTPGFHSVLSSAHPVSSGRPSMLSLPFPSARTPRAENCTTQGAFFGKVTDSLRTAATWLSGLLESKQTRRLSVSLYFPSQLWVAAGFPEVCFARGGPIGSQHVLLTVVIKSLLSQLPLSGSRDPSGPTTQGLLGLPTDKAATALLLKSCFWEWNTGYVF